MNNYSDYYNVMNSLNQKMDIKKNDGDKKIGYETEPYIGFSRGNMFSDIYDPYQNYQVQELNPTNEQEYSLLLVQMYGFAAHDLGLYLDVNPNDSKVLNLRNKYISLYNQALDDYEKNYGPLCLSSKFSIGNTWTWDSKKWPWEGNR